ncbi:MAG: tripartite tricarboxylate transporter TctB family protein [Sphaerochaetaceae bacterium]|jgi:putative tricarboxylic transport membrane protein|nr:tripartite tricarboxylate transporter TctB family protein [Sphaerochaetaceae bacterium]MDC7237580.1 tripartite tricarboxylate transporter TctB family protein [Sphaerochaetaceae bacterium]
MNRLMEKVDNLIDNSALKLEKHKMTIPINIVGSILFIIVSSILLYLVPSQIKINTEAVVNARTFPLLMLRIVLIFSIILLIKDIIFIITKREIETKELNLLVEVKFLIILSMLIIFLALLYFTNFILSSIVFGILMLFYFRSKKLSNYLIIILAAILIGYLFQNVLHVRLP